ncbi:MAG: right-handed parallel beta-helix repeat-containing protein, partial [Gemmatimonadales bacterium]|nr:right-handed parallel beta-helix repeat-containing protein [Gemmatimonadales bacterium]
GVRILGEDAGTLTHVHLRDLDVHDVNGSLTVGRDQGKCNAGILVDVVGSTTPTKFDDLLIEGCYVYSCQRSGIKI